jgi:hypothetical protein
LPIIGIFPILVQIFYMVFSEVIRPFAEEPLTLQILLDLFKDYKRPYDKINELVKKGELIMVKKGFYVPGTRLNIPRPESFLIANHLWGPSYVSLESALSHWSLIPERVYEISSVTMKSTKAYQTPVGRFTYLHASVPYYSFGIKSVALTKKQFALVASPEKALCDKIVMTSGIFLRSTIQVKEFLLEDLRMETEALRQLNLQQIASWTNDAPKKSSLAMLIKTLQDL